MMSFEIEATVPSGDWPGAQKKCLALSSPDAAALPLSIAPAITATRATAAPRVLLRARMLNLHHGVDWRGGYTVNLANANARNCVRLLTDESVRAISTRGRDSPYCYGVGTGRNGAAR